MFILGFHGCDRAVAEQVFAGRAGLKASQNEYDWLGHGVYFWENNPRRALDYARMLKRNPRRGQGRITEPAVVGAVIDLGLCLNLLDTTFIQLTKKRYQDLKILRKEMGTGMPENRTAGGSKDLLLRHLDCAVIETVHFMRRKSGERPFDTARGVFVEGKAIYPGAGINEHNHIQVCVRNMGCIKGYFRVLE